MILSHVFREGVVRLAHREMRRPWCRTVRPQWGLRLLLRLPMAVIPRLRLFPRGLDRRRRI